MDGAPDALVGSTATQVSRERRVDVGIGGRRVLCQERGSRHQLSRLAIPAFGHLFSDPRPLQAVAAVRGEPLDRRHHLVADGGDGGLARANGQATQVDGAGAAEANTAAKFGAC